MIPFSKGPLCSLYKRGLGEFYLEGNCKHFGNFYNLLIIMGFSSYVHLNGIWRK